jgi:hypothetical protein
MSLKKIKDVIMDYNINKNRSVFMKTNKPDPDRFFQFTENWSVTI